MWVPPITAFDTHLHSVVTDEKRQLTLSDISDLPLGHVPRTLAGVFRCIMDSGGRIFAEPTGEPVPSFPPWPAPHEKGGGVVIPCHYVVHHSNTAYVVSLLCDALKSMPEGYSMHLVQS